MMNTIIAAVYVMAGRNDKPKTVAIQARAKAAAAETAAPVGGPNVTNELQDRLWALCSPLPVSAFESPWENIAADLWARLAVTLQAPGAARVAAPASRLGYSECVRTLVRDKVMVIHRILTEIRGLALAAAPALVDAEKNRVVAPAQPGIPLLYEDIAIY